MNDALAERIAAALERIATAFERPPEPERCEHPIELVEDQSTMGHPKRVCRRCQEDVTALVAL